MIAYKEFEIDVDVREAAGGFVAAPLVRRDDEEGPEGLEFPPIGLFQTYEDAKAAGLAWARQFIDLNW